MKKMYKKPIVEQEEMLCSSSVLTGSSVVNNDPLDPSGDPNNVIAD